jgi:hypothetical protein
MWSDQENLDLFRVYLDQVGQHPLLTGADEVELSQAIEAGDDAARRKMIESNLPQPMGDPSIGPPLSHQGQHPGEPEIMPSRGPAESPG